MDISKIPINIDRNFQKILVLAVDYSCGRMTYMPKTVTDVIKPLLPALNRPTLKHFIKIIEEQATRSLGWDCDEETWRSFQYCVEQELKKKYRHRDIKMTAYYNDDIELTVLAAYRSLVNQNEHVHPLITEYIIPVFGLCISTPHIETMVQDLDFYEQYPWEDKHRTEEWIQFRNKLNELYNTRKLEEANKKGKMHNE